MGHKFQSPIADKEIVGVNFLINWRFWWREFVVRRQIEWFSSLLLVSSFCLGREVFDGSSFLVVLLLFFICEAGNDEGGISSYRTIQARYDCNFSLDYWLLIYTSKPITGVHTSKNVTSVMTPNKTTEKIATYAMKRGYNKSFYRLRENQQTDPLAKTAESCGSTQLIRV